MQDNTITARQLYYLFVLSIIPILVLYIPGEPAAIVKQEAWLAVILAVVIATAFLYYPLADMGMHFRGRTIIQYSENVAGRYLGKIFGLAVLYHFFQLHCWTLREMGEFSLVIFPRSPLIVFLVMMSLGTVCAAAGGIRTIGRLADYIYPVGFGILVFILLAGTGIAEFSNLLPLMNASPGTVIRATIGVMDWLAIGLTFGALTAFADRPERLKFIGFYASITTGMIVLSFTIITIAVFGSELINLLNFPYLMMARSIRSGIFSGRIESILVAGWLVWIFMTAAVSSYLTALGIAQWFGLSGYRSIIIPETILAVAYSLYEYKSFMEMSYLFSMAHLYYLIFSFGTPFLLWLVFLVRFRIFRPPAQPSQHSGL